MNAIFKTIIYFLDIFQYYYLYYSHFKCYCKKNNQTYYFKHFSKIKCLFETLFEIKINYIFNL